MIRLSKRDIDFLAGFEPPANLRDVLASAQGKDGVLTDEEADALRDFCGDRLQTLGFGPVYEPTQTGRRLEELIDRLFVG